MIQSYFKIAWRYLQKHRLFTLINVLGLGIGMSCCLFIYIFVRHELSYDQFHANKERLYRIVYHANNGYDFARVPPPLAPLAASNLAEVETSARVYSRSISVSIPNPSSMRDDQDYEENNVLMVDSSFFDVFELEYLAGSQEENLSLSQRVILSEELAAKYFGDNWLYNPPLGKTILIEGNHPYQIAAIVRDFPENSHISFSMLLPYDDMFTLIENEDQRRGMRENLAQNWVISHSHAYVLLREGADPAGVDRGMEQLLQTYAPEPLRVGQRFSLQPVEDIYLASEVFLNPGPSSDVSNIYIFSAIALLTLLIACFNFINLSTAQSLKRAKEVGMRKVLGARKPQLFLQFLGESLMISLLALMLAILMIGATLPEFNQLTGKNFSPADLYTLPVALAFVGIFLLAGLLGGSYPAVYMTQMKLASILKQKSPLRGRLQAFSLRQVLVLIQFTMSIALIAGTVMIYRQLIYLQNQSTGFIQEAVLTLPLYSSNMNNIFGAGDQHMRQRMNSFEESLLRNARVEAITLSSGAPGIGFVARRTEPEGMDTEGRLFVPTMAVDYDFAETYGLEIVAGRDFDIQAGTDHISSFIVNETAVRNFGWGTAEEALGKEIDLEGKKGNVIGVVKDFNYTSLYSPIGSLVMGVDVPLFNTFSIRIGTQDFSETIAYVEKVWQEFFPHKTFEYDFLDEQLQTAYQDDARLGRIIGIFSALAILVSCLGSYGLALLLARQKEKEIGIRKVLGANIVQIVSLLTRGYFTLILLSSLLAVPLAYWSMGRWLENFAYRTEMSWWLFGLAILTVMLIALATVSIQTIKAAAANPVNALKDE
jgi:putative ABC transport system permease protein